MPYAADRDAPLGAHARPRWFPRSRDGPGTRLYEGPHCGSARRSQGVHAPLLVHRPYPAGVAGVRDWRLICFRALPVADGPMEMSWDSGIPEGRKAFTAEPTGRAQGWSIGFLWVLCRQAVLAR